MLGKVVPDPEDHGFGFGHRRPRRLRIAINASSQSLGVRAKNLVHGAANGAIEIAIPACRDKVGVCAQKRIECFGIEVFPKNIDRICAEQMERVGAHEIVPELLQPDGGRELAFLPKEADYFAIGAKPRVGGRPHFPNQGSDGPLEAAPIRLPIHHEPPEGLLCIGK
jgi:hypothetical protein